jgi:hypothetical protein
LPRDRDLSLELTFAQEAQRRRRLHGENEAARNFSRGLDDGEPVLSTQNAHGHEGTLSRRLLGSASSHEPRLHPNTSLNSSRGAHEAPRLFTVEREPSVAVRFSAVLRFH